MCLDISLVLFLQLQHLLVTSFPLNMTPRIDAVGLCVRGGELELLDGEGFCHSELQERYQILPDEGNMVRL